MKTKSPIGVLLILFFGVLELGCGESPSPSPQVNSSPSPMPAQKSPSAKIREENQQMVKTALEKMTDGQQVAVEEIVDSQCGGTKSKYKLTRDGEKLGIQLDIYVDFDSDVKDPVALIAKTDACLPQIKAVWERYGIDLKVNLYDQKKANEKNYSYKNWSRIIKIREGYKRSNAEEFYIENPQFCLMVLHEYGHHMGLADEYSEEGTCRKPEYAAKEENPWSVMQTHYMGWENIEFLPRHLKTILGPIHDLEKQVPERFSLKAREDVLLDWYYYRAQAVFPHPETGKEGCEIEFGGYFTKEDRTLKKGSEFILTGEFEKFRDKEGKSRYFSKYFNLETEPVYGRIVPFEEPKVRNMHCNLSIADWEKVKEMLSAKFEFTALPAKP